MKRLIARPLLLAAVATFALTLHTAAARAQDEEEAAEEEDVPAAPVKKATKKVAAAEDSQPVSDVEGYKFPRGLYTMSDLGFFWRYLGFADTGGREQCFRCKYPTYLVSNGQPFIGISVGYDLLPTILDYIPNFKAPDIVKRFGVSGQLSLGTGYVANAAPWSAARSRVEGPISTVKPEESPKDHAILMAHPALAVNFIPPPFERVVMEARVFAGPAAFTPSAQRFARAFADPKWWLSTFGVDFGIGISIKYMTLLTNFVIGSDLALYTLVSPSWPTEFWFTNCGGARGCSTFGRIIGGDPTPANGIGFSSGKDAPAASATSYSLMIPVTVASSFSPIIIKYVF